MITCIELVYGIKVSMVKVQLAPEGELNGALTQIVKYKQKYKIRV